MKVFLYSRKVLLGRDRVVLQARFNQLFDRFSGPGIPKKKKKKVVNELGK